MIVGIAHARLQLTPLGRSRAKETRDVIDAIQAVRSAFMEETWKNVQYLAQRCMGRGHGALQGVLRDRAQLSTRQQWA